MRTNGRLPQHPGAPRRTTAADGSRARTWLVILVALAVATGIVATWIWLDLGTSVAPARDGDTQQLVDRATASSIDTSQIEVASSATRRVAAPRSRLAETASYSFPAGHCDLEVVVFDGTGMIRSGAAVVVRPVVHAAHVKVRAVHADSQQATTDDRGLVVFHRLPFGTYEVSGTFSGGGADQHSVVLARNASNGPRRIVLQLSEPQLVTCTVHVLDARQHPVAGARVVAMHSHDGSPTREEALGESDARGQLTAAVAPGLFVVKATAADLTGVSFALIPARDRAAKVGVRLAPSGSLRCTLPAAYDGATLVAALAIGNGSVRDRDILAGPEQHRAQVDDGAARFADLPSGRYVIALEGAPDAALLAAGPGQRSASNWPGGVGKRTDPGWPPRAVIATVESGMETRLDLVVARGLAVRGQVTWRDGGEPVSGAQLLCRPADRAPDAGTTRIAGRASDSLFATGLFDQTTLTDDRGNYAFERLSPGLYEIAVTGSDCSRSHQWIMVSAGHDNVVDHTVVPAGMLVGSTPVPLVMRLQPQAGGNDFLCNVRGTFTIPGLPPGDYVLSISDPRAETGGLAAMMRAVGGETAAASDRRIEVALTIEPGKATLCDLCDHLEHVRGVVTWNGAPATHAKIRLDGESVVVAEDGSFLLPTLRNTAQKLWVEWQGVVQSFEVVAGSSASRIELPDTELAIDVRDALGASVACLLTITGGEARWLPRRLDGSVCRLRGLPRGEYHIAAFAEAGDRLQVLVRVEARHEISLVVPDSESLAVRVLDAVGVPLHGAYVMLKIDTKTPAGTAYPAQSESSDVAGVAHFARVPTGAVDVIVEHRGKRVMKSYQLESGSAGSLDVVLGQ